MKNRIFESTIYEAYFDLYGYTMEWINKIVDALLDYSEQSKGDDCEAYRLECCMAVRFQSTSKTRVEKAKTIFQKLASKAAKTVSKNRIYHRSCG